MSMFVFLEALGLLIAVGVAVSVAMATWVFALARLEAATVPARVAPNRPQHYRRPGAP
ncbi:MAG: hypothetical protein M3R71_04920 [Actinomycetota bacterium]|nr:hypothetical protein [Actinomycetota bacterium]